MKATFNYTLRRLRGSLLGWGLSLLVLGFLMSRTYSMVEQQGEEIQSLLENMPGMLDFFGTENFITPQSYLHVRFFSLIPIVLGIFAAAAGSGLLVQDDEAGRLDLLMAYPISRCGLFFARLAALVVVMLGILALGWVGLAIGMIAVAMKLSPLVPLWGFVSLFSVVLLTATLGLLLSLTLSARRQAGMAAGLVIVASFFLTGFARLDEELRPLAKILPLYYYQGGEAMNEFDPIRFGGLIAASVVGIGLAYWRFERRDIRVAGEGVVPWKKYAIGAGVVFGLGGVFWAASLRPTTYESPEQAFEAAATALEKERWDTFVASLTPDAKQDWTAAMVLFASALELQGDTLAPKKLLQAPESVSIGQLQAMFAMLGKFKVAMKHVDKERLKEHATLIRGTLVIALLSKGDLPLTREHRKLAELVKDSDQFLVKALRAWSTAHQYGGWQLSPVTTDGDAASGMLRLPSGTKDVTFERIGGSWHVGLPFVTGERRETIRRAGAAISP
jgi:ABC-2 type transport system permease protein